MLPSNTPECRECPVLLCHEPLAAAAAAALASHPGSSAGERTMAPPGTPSSYLGTLGGARLGREGTWGGPPWPSALGNGGRAPGRNGTGGAPDCGPGEGMAGAGPRPDKGRVGGLFRVGLLGVEGLGGGDLGKQQRFQNLGRWGCGF